MFFPSSVRPFLIQRIHAQRWRVKWEERSYQKQSFGAMVLAMLLTSQALLLLCWCAAEDESPQVEEDAISGWRIWKSPVVGSEIRLRIPNLKLLVMLFPSYSSIWTLLLLRSPSLLYYGSSLILWPVCIPCEFRCVCKNVMKNHFMVYALWFSFVVILWNGEEWMWCDG